MIDHDSSLSLLLALRFAPVEGKNGVYHKEYCQHNGYALIVDFNEKRIDYGPHITIGDKTTSNFSHAENFVVLECVDRCLEKGYSPQSIILEPKWQLGHNEKGKLDILIKQDGKAWLMIECKTWGGEYTKELNKMRRDGGQLISYYVQDKSAQYLCLYTSHVDDGEVHYDNAIIAAEERWQELNNQKEIYEQWDKTFKQNGIFNTEATPYNAVFKAMTIKDLKPLREKDSSVIFNRFAEILRHNVVSDKPNAFNKILNLFLCKILDEQWKAEDEELDFQWIEGKDTFQSLQTRLNNLYKEGMNRFLGLEIVDYTDKEFDAKLSNIHNAGAREAVAKMFNDLRLKKNPEFAFKEVYDDASFAANGQVVKEVVELLQKYKFRYSHKQQFLGNFFELLLNTSIKQEAGQFFTPVPVAKFLVSSLPIDKLIRQKIEAREADFLPYMIDYAAGSGHFLTEWMDEVQRIIESLDSTNEPRPVKSKLKSWVSDQFAWASEFVYGIDADYRLVKTAKVSAFLNGDGDARIIRADGLDSFKGSNDYVGILTKYDKDNPQNNAQFDVLIANPPYSVSAFKNTMNEGANSFELYPYLSDQSSEIECLFVERAKQLLKPGGMAAIILPSSILSNTGIYTRTREILLKYFSIRAIAKMSSDTFMATGTNTVVLFMERRPNNDWQVIHDAITRFMERPKDVTVAGIEKAFSVYVDAVYNNLSFADYADWIAGRDNANIESQTLMKDYHAWFDSLTEIKNLKAKRIFKDKPPEEKNTELRRLFREKVLLAEHDRMLYFLLTYHQRTVLVDVGEKKEGKNFLGYEFSNRRGHEGIRMYTDSDGKETTRLYDDMKDAPSDNPEKANYYISRAFLGEYPDIDKSLQKNITLHDTVSLFDFSARDYQKVLSLAPKKKEVASKWPIVRLGEVCEILNGGTPSTREKEYWNGDIPWATLVDTKDKYLYSTQRKITREGLEHSNAVLLPINTVIFSSRATIGEITIAKIKTCTNQGYKNFICDKSKIDYRFLYYILGYKKNAIESLAAGMTYKEISKEKISSFPIPLPPLPEQRRIVAELEAAEKAIIDLRDIPAQLDVEAQNLFIEMFGDPATNPKGWPMVRLGEVCEIVRDSVSPHDVHTNTTYIALEDIDENGCFINKSNIEERHIKSSKYRFEVGNILYGKLRPYLKKIAIPDFAGICSTDIIPLLPLHKESYFFLYHALRHPFFINMAVRLSSGINLPRITPNKLRDFQIPLPPLDLQAEFSERAEEIEKQKAAVRSQIPEAERDFAALQDRLFSGR